MEYHMRLAPIFLGIMALMVTSLPVSAFDTIAQSAFVLDKTSGTVLLAKNADQPVPPASMSKLMTLNMLFEALQDGRVNLDTKFTVSKKASEKGGSKMFVKQGERVSVENLIRGIIVHSGNDACIVVAENLAGSEADFARIMTSRARKLGMKNSTFANATGWPNPNHRMSARDLITLADRLITQFPEFYNWMYGSDAIVIAEKSWKIASDLIDNADLIFCLDFNDLHRVGNLQEKIRESDAVKIMIDHHQHPKDFADHMISRVDSCSTAQLIYEFIESNNDRDLIDSTIAEGIYTGIITDSGSFKYSNVESKVHANAGGVGDAEADTISVGAILFF